MRTIVLLVAWLIYSTQSLGESLRSEEIEFVSHGATLSGTIVFPPEGDTHSAVVFIHGSGEQTRDLNWAERFAREGIAALVYDNLSIERLKALRRKGHRYDYVLFSGLGHNNMDRTFFVATDWIRRSSQSRAHEGQKASSKR